MEINVDGVTYVPKSSRPSGNRAVVVVNRGWIFAGDVTEENGRIRLDNAVWVFRWERIGFAEVIRDPTQDGVDIRTVPYPVDIPASAEVYRVPVPEGWGA